MGELRQHSYRQHLHFLISKCLKPPQSPPKRLQSQRPSLPIPHPPPWLWLPSRPLRAPRDPPLPPSRNTSLPTTRLTSSKFPPSSVKPSKSWSKPRNCSKLRDLSN